MSCDSIILGLDEAIRINKGELKGRRETVEISPAKKN
jgi:hypothetical protein